MNRAKEIEIKWNREEEDVKTLLYALKVKRWEMFFSSFFFRFLSFLVFSVDVVFSF